MIPSRDHPTSIDLTAILIDPSAIYDEPADVVRDARLSDADKRRILEAWQIDARELQVAEEEGMAGGEPNMMVRVHDALVQLDHVRH